MNDGPILNPVDSPAVTTTYTLSITDASGCKGSDDVLVEVVPACAKPMNAITPNGDGTNDKWLVTYGNCLGNAGVRVFNRYGSLCMNQIIIRIIGKGPIKEKICRTALTIM